MDTNETWQIPITRVDSNTWNIAAPWRSQAFDNDVAMALFLGLALGYLGRMSKRFLGWLSTSLANGSRWRR